MADIWQTQRVRKNHVPKFSTLHMEHHVGLYKVSFTQTRAEVSNGVSNDTNTSLLTTAFFYLFTYLTVGVNMILLFKKLRSS